VQRDLVFSDPATSRLFGLSAEDGASGQPLIRYFDAIEGEDQPAVRAAIDLALEGNPYSATYRVGGNGKHRQLLAIGRCYLDHLGEPSYFPGFVLDISHEASPDLELIDQHVKSCLRIADRIQDDAITYLLSALLNGLRLEIDRTRSRGKNRQN
jgi:hypothetical protein